MKLASFTHYSHNDGAIILPMPILSQSFRRDGERHMGHAGAEAQLRCTGSLNTALECLM